MEDARRQFLQNLQRIKEHSETFMRPFFLRTASQRDLSKVGDIFMSFIYDPTVALTPFYSYDYNYNGTKVYLTSAKNLTQDQIKDAVQMFANNYRKEINFAEKIFNYTHTDKKRFIVGYV